MNLKLLITNSIYFIAVFVFAFVVAGLALARKTNSQRLTSNEFALTVVKDEVALNNPISGKVETIFVAPGQSVSKGDTLVQLSDEISEAKLATLEKYKNDNLSASTEAQILKSNLERLTIVAPRNGTINSVDVSTGSYLTQNTKVLTMIADDGVKLHAILPSRRLSEVEQAKAFEALSSRLGLSYTVVFTGTSRVSGNLNGELSYELLFEFKNPEEGSAFLNGDILDVKWVTNSSARKPNEVITDLWNSLIIYE